jgi:hypothetical protein
MFMKRITTLIFALISLAISSYAQNFPYSKILKYSQDDFRNEKFKYDEDNNQWILRKSHGGRVALNILSAISGGDADIRPDKRDYAITAQMGDNELIAYVNVLFYDDDTFHKLLTFAKDNGENLVDTDSDNIHMYQFNYGGYNLSLQIKPIKITATTGRTNVALVKSIDKSYNAYQFTIYTGVEATSPYLTRQAAKKARKEAKGKKKDSVNDYM